MIMNYRIIYIILLIFSSVLAQKAKGLSNQETIIYKIIKNPTTQQDSLMYVGKSRSEVTQALGQPEAIYRNDDNNADEFGYTGHLTFTYADNDPDIYDVLLLRPNPTGDINPYVISKKYKLGIGRPIPKELLDSVEYGVYIKASPGKPLTPTEEAALPPSTLKQYSFQLAVPDGSLSDGSLTIDVQDGKIIKLYIGY